MCSHPKKSPAFTLIELLVVLALLSLVAGLSLARWDGWSDQARFQTAVANHAQVLRLAELEARVSGSPRLMEYQQGTVLLRKPVRQGSGWQWDDGLRFELPAGIRCEGIMFEDSARADRSAGLQVAGDGRFPTHAVVFGAGGRGIAALFNVGEEPRITHIDQLRRIKDWQSLPEKVRNRHETP